MKSIVIAVFLTTPAWALPTAVDFQNGDVIVASMVPACVTDPPPPADSQIALYGRDASKVRDLSPAVIGTARYISGAIFVASSNSIDTLTNTGTLIPFIGLPAGARATALGAAGSDLLAIVYRGAQPELWRRTPQGVIDVAVLPQYDNYINTLDVASDRCTMFYGTVFSIERFDICGKHALPTFTRTFVSAVRVLPDGGLLAGSGTDLIRFDAGGSTVSRFPIGVGAEGIGAIALDTNPSLVWALTTFNCGSGVSRVMQVSVATGAITAGPHSVSRSAALAIAVQGEWRAAVDAPPRRRAVR
jgi:hypothetical protein